MDEVKFKRNLESAISGMRESCDRAEQELTGENSPEEQLACVQGVLCGGIANASMKITNALMILYYDRKRREQKNDSPSKEAEEKTRKVYNED